MSRRLIIVTAGGFARETAAWARDAGFEVIGFLHDLDRYPDSLDGADLGAPVLGPTAPYRPGSEAVAIGLGGSKRRELADRMIEQGARLATIIHPTAWIAPNAEIGEGVVIAPFVCVGPKAKIGDLSILNMHAVVAHDVSVGRCCNLSPHSAAVGSSVLEDEVFLATHAVVAPKIRVGARSVVSAGSVVLDDMPPDSFIRGNPAY